MSIRIFNAFKIEKPLEEILDSLEILKKEVSSVIMELEKKEIAELATSALDAWWLKKANILPSENNAEDKEDKENSLSENQTALFYAWKTIMEEQRQAKKEDRVCIYDHGLEVYLLKSSKNKWLMICSSQSSILKEWIKEKVLALGGEDYEYWDHTDKSESVSASQWASRKGTWNRVFNKAGSWVPSEAGLIKVLAQKEMFKYLPKPQEIGLFQPSKEQRIQKQWFDLGLTKIINEARKEDPSKDILKMVWSAQRKVSEGLWDKDKVFYHQIEQALLDNYDADCFSDMEKLNVLFEKYDLNQKLGMGGSVFKARI